MEIAILRFILWYEEKGDYLKSIENRAVMPYILKLAKFIPSLKFLSYNTFDKLTAPTTKVSIKQVKWVRYDVTESTLLFHGKMLHLLKSVIFSQSVLPE